MDEEKRETTEEERPSLIEERPSLIEEKHAMVSPKIENNPDKILDTKKIQKKLKKNPWIISSIVLAIICVVLLFGVPGGNNSSGISGKVAGESVVEFLNQRGAGVEYVGFEDIGDLYEVTVKYQGNDIPLFVTKDGEYFVQTAVPINGEIPTPQPPSTPDYTEGDLVNIKEFAECLADKGVKAYGAGWCGYCKALKEEFGGEDPISPIYVECQDAQRNPTENSELCTEEEISGFPTIKINDEAYKGPRTLVGLAEATECPAPVISGE
jgi:hypothetical protein